MRAFSGQFARLGIAALAWAACPGCARSAEERQLDEMRSEIDRMQVERDRADEVILPAETSPPSAPSNGGGSPSPPATTAASRVVEVAAVAPVGLGLGAGGAGGELLVDTGDGDTEDPTPRPTIRMTGSTRVGTAQLMNDGDDSASASETTLDPQAKRAYDAALGLVNRKECGKAVDAFAAFLVKWPDHPYADNAMFWRGECFFRAGDYARTVEQLTGELSRFPAGSKAPDALLKLGLAEGRLGDAAKQRDCFDRLLKLYPQSDAARRIPATAGAAPAATPRGPASEDLR